MTFSTTRRPGGRNPYRDTVRLTRSLPEESSGAWLQMKKPDRGTKVKIEDSGDLYTELMKLDQLRKDGIITDQEFETQKKKLLERK